jgi:hypothetical protein
LSRFWYPAMASSPRRAVIDGIPRVMVGSLCSVLSGTQGGSFGSNA